MAQALGAANAVCAQLPEKAYIVDCLAERLGQIARSMPATGALAEARALRGAASRALEGLARSNADQTLPRANARTTAVRTTRPLGAVNRATGPSVAARAATILERTETMLLRSAARTDLRQISAAVGSSKVLLRSV